MSGFQNHDRQSGVSMTTPRPDVGVDVDVVRFENAGGCPIVGVRSRDGVRPLAVQTNGHLLRLSPADLRTAVEDGLRTPPLARDDIRVLSFVDGRTEVWAAGVTYLRSKRAREQESRNRRSTPMFMITTAPSCSSSRRLGVW